MESGISRWSLELQDRLAELLEAHRQYDLALSMSPFGLSMEQLQKLRDMRQTLADKEHVAVERFLHAAGASR